jgi:hypothetical protein
MFDADVSLPPMSIFPGHASLLDKFVGRSDPTNSHLIGTQEAAIIDSLVTIGLWLEKSNKFVNGPLEDEDFMQYLQDLSLVSINTPSPTLRYGAHTLLTSILHAHPVDQTRLTFILETLENCPDERLKASAVGWLKDEIITAHERKTDNAFSNTVAIASAQPYLLQLDKSALTQENISEAWDEFGRGFPFYMAVLNFLYFIKADAYADLVPQGLMAFVEKVYLTPLLAAQERFHASLQLGGELHKSMEEGEADMARGEGELLAERIALITG